MNKQKEAKEIWEKLKYVEQSDITDEDIGECLQKINASIKSMHGSFERMDESLDRMIASLEKVTGKLNEKK